MNNTYENTYEQQAIEQFPIVDCMPYYPFWDDYTLISSAISNNDVALVAGLLHSTTIQISFDLNDMTKYYAPQGSEVEDYLLHNGASVDFLAMESFLNNEVANLDHYLSKGANVNQILDSFFSATADFYGRVHVHVPEDMAYGHYFNGMYENPWQPNDHWVKIEGYGTDWSAYDNFSNTIMSVLQPYIDEANSNAIVENVSVMPELPIYEGILA